ncbi:hypothetical protein MHU86_1339 [Fragilaria crotonensis]|nr:hypothetical protein MHU86_1339 [Fragilaria crotonensis]
MTDEAAMPPPPAYPTFEEVEHSVYGFDCDKWEDIPYPDGPDWFTDSERSRRNELANRYQKHGGTPTGWARYLELGFFGYEDCSEFEDVWNNFDVKPLEVHKAIWYQFMYHLDREFEISEKLQEWSTNYSHIYVAYHDPASLQVDTFASLKEWKILQDRDASMEDEDRNNTECWIDVPERGRRRDKSPPKEHESTQLHSNIPARQAIKELHNQLKQSKRYQKTMKPASKLPQVLTVHEEEEEDYQMEDNNSQDNKTEKWSDALPRLKPFKNVPVNDGTHRLTLRWKPPGGIQQYETDKQTLNQAIQMLLSAVLDDDDGMLYRWESKDLKTFSTISKLTGTELRDYISPQISFIHTTSQIIFGVRLSFTDNPVNWQNGPGKKQQLKDNQVEIKVSNSSSTGGKSVIAGYILLKAPNTTSTHRYTQYIRSLMPEATPYFDIERYKKTPMGQIIPHLVVQCGESHVTPVCQALLHVLQGKGTAVFLPDTFSAQ